MMEEATHDARPVLMLHFESLHKSPGFGVEVHNLHNSRHASACPQLGAVVAMLPWIGDTKLKPAGAPEEPGKDSSNVVESATRAGALSLE